MKSYRKQGIKLESMQQNMLRKFSPLSEGSGTVPMEVDIQTELSDIQLFLLPFAGANLNSYRGLETVLKDLGIRSTTLELPGHGARGAEPLLTSLSAMEDDLSTQLEAQAAQPYVLFGHSMGSLLAYRLAQKFISKKMPPLCLIVSGRAAPSVPLRHNRIHALPQDEFFEEVRRLGGSPEAILQNRELMEYFEPILRADFQAVETYKHIDEPALPLPVSVVIGADDTVLRDDVECWGRHAQDAIQLTVLPGGHFYLLEKPDETAQIIRHSILAAL